MENNLKCDLCRQTIPGLFHLGHFYCLVCYEKQDEKENLD